MLGASLWCYSSPEPRALVLLKAAAARPRDPAVLRQLCSLLLLCVRRVGRILQRVHGSPAAVFLCVPAAGAYLKSRGLLLWPCILPMYPRFYLIIVYPPKIQHRWHDVRVFGDVVRRSIVLLDEDVSGRTRPHGLDGREDVFRHLPHVHLFGPLHLRRLHRARSPVPAVPLDRRRPGERYRPSFGC